MTTTFITVYCFYVILIRQYISNEIYLFVGNVRIQSAKGRDRG